ASSRRTPLLSQPQRRGQAPLRERRAHGRHVLRKDVRAAGCPAPYRGLAYRGTSTGGNAGAMAIVWRPSEEVVEAANVSRFMRTHGISTAEQLRRRSVEDI